MTDAARHVLLMGAISIAFLHTIVGVDHYLPFVVLGKARKWSLRKVLTITALCGVGHVLSSVVIGFVGIALGLAAGQLEGVEGARGSLAAWALIAFGLVYAAWSAVRTARGHHHSHPHAHSDGTIHEHPHDHHREHLHPHESGTDAQLTKWTLFVVFVLGPCEALIPLVMAPAALHDWATIITVSLVFSAVTIATMLAMVTLGTAGMRLVRMPGLERHANTLAGLAVATSGIAIVALGL